MALIERAMVRLPDGKGTPDAFAAFAELMRRIGGALLGALIALGVAHQKAEEYAQDALAEAWKSLPGFRFESKFLTWVTKIARNRYFKESGQRGRGKQEKRERVELDSSEAREASRHDSPVEAAALREERLALIRRLSEDLPDDMRQAFVYRHIEGLSYEEIAQIMAPLTEEEVTTLARQGLDRLEYATRHEREGRRR